MKPETITDHYNPVFDVLKNAKHEIVVLDRYLSLDRPDMNLGSNILERSLAEYTKLVLDENRHGIYSRVIQTDSGTAATLNQSEENVFTQHFRHVIDLDHPRASLHVAPVVSSIKFTVIDREIIVVQIHRRMVPQGTYEVEGELILRDPSGQLGEIFINIYEKALKRSLPIRQTDVPSFWS